MTLLPKPERVRVPEYRAWLATQACCVCGKTAGVVGHHVETGGAGTKGSDLLEVPLCPGCHRNVHDHGAERFLVHMLGFSFAWYYTQVARHLARWLIEDGVLLCGTREGKTMYVKSQDTERRGEKIRAIRAAAVALAEVCDEGL